jgi:hypothetical protein
MHWIRKILNSAESIVGVLLAFVTGGASAWGLRSFLRFAGDRYLFPWASRHSLHLAGWLFEVLCWLVALALVALTVVWVYRRWLRRQELALRWLRKQELDISLHTTLASRVVIEDRIAAMDLPNYVNFDVLDTTAEPSRTLRVEEGLNTHLDYTLVVKISQNPDIRYFGEHQDSIERPRGDKVTLDVVLALPENIELLSNPWTTLEWPELGSSTNNAEFRFRPSLEGNAHVKVLVYFEHDLLFSGDLQFEVRSEGYTWPDGANAIQWKHLSPERVRRLSVFRRFRDLDRNAQRGFNIFVQRYSNDAFELICFLRGAHAQEAVYPLRIEISSQELTGLLARTRMAMRMLTEMPNFRRSVQASYGDSGSKLDQLTEPDKDYPFDEFLHDMSVIGGEAWARLFQGEEGQRLSRMVLDTLRGEDHIIQVAVDSSARDFIFPWVWLYPLRAAGKAIATETSLFWGYHYVIEQLRLLPDGRRSTGDLDLEMIRLAGWLHNFTTTQYQRNYFAKCVSRYPDRFAWKEVARDEYKTYLTECDADIVYFWLCRKVRWK